MLRLLGLECEAREHGAAITRLFGRAAPSQHIVLDVRYADLRQGSSAVAIHRGALFKLLLDAARIEGIMIQTDHEIDRTEQVPGDGRMLHFTERHSSGPFDLVVDALGAISRLAGTPPSPLGFGALWATLNWSDVFDDGALEQRYDRARKMVGVLPVGRMPGEAGRKAAFFWSLRGCDHPTWRAAGLDPWKSEVRALWPETAPLLDQIVEPGQLAFARYCHRTLARPTEPNIVHLGDAWHATSPQLGQGANMALLDAAALAGSLCEAETLSQALTSYARRRRRHVHLYQALSRIFTPFYQSEGNILPWLRDHLVGPLSRVRPIPRLLANIVAGTLVASGAPSNL
jgi:2-polyprenyl-6-methoxyphenol hydroxylase-like FAD-dependent oxidoreductase